MARVIFQLFKYQFELVAKHYGWTEGDKVFHLTESLKGEALEYFVNMPEDVRSSYDAAVQQLESVFSIQEKAHAVRLELSSLKQNVDETLESFFKRVRMMVIYIPNVRDGRDRFDGDGDF